MSKQVMNCQNVPNIHLQYGDKHFRNILADELMQIYSGKARQKKGSQYHHPTFIFLCAHSYLSTAISYLQQQTDDFQYCWLGDSVSLQELISKQKAITDDSRRKKSPFRVYFLTKKGKTFQTINRIKFKQYNINQIMLYSNQSFLVLNQTFYPQLHLQPASLPFCPQLQQLLLQTQNLKRQHALLQIQLNEAQHQKQMVFAENLRLKEELLRSNIKIKRKYRKRRVYLQKKFVCKAEGCVLKYSSKVALNSHLRKKHLALGLAQA